MNLKIKQFIKMFCQHVIFPMVYFLNRFRAVDEKKIILADAHHESCPPHMTAVSEALRLYDVSVEEFFFDLSNCSQKEGFSYMIRFMKSYARAKAVIICDNFLPVASCKKREETKVVQLWHGCGALKKFGFDAEDDIPKGYKGNVYQNYDLVTVSGKKVIEYFSSAMKCENVRAIGVCHTDRLYDKEYYQACRDRFRFEYPDAQGKKVVLWLPTFRGNAANPYVVGEAYMDSLKEKHESDIYVIKCLHPHMMKQNKDCMTSDDLLLCADIVITDYSSVLFEAALLKKQLILFAPDYAEYTEKRGFYLDYESLPYKKVLGTEKGKNATDKNEINTIKSSLLAELEKSIFACDEVPENNTFLDTDKQTKEQQLFLQQYMGACDGNATDRIVSFILE